MATATEQRLRVSLMRVGDATTPVPHYATPGAAGMDLAAALTAPLSIEPGRRALVGTGWAMAVPEGYEAQVRPRSGLALRHGVTVLNTPGTVDSDYRGELKVLLINLGEGVFVVNPGDRIAQVVVCPVARVSIDVTTALDDTGRGSGGYGSTGVAS